MRRSSVARMERAGWEDSCGMRYHEGGWDGAITCGERWYGADWAHVRADLRQLHDIESEILDRWANNGDFVVWFKWTAVLTYDGTKIILRDI
jgi:hypothetical protein